MQTWTNSQPAMPVRLPLRRVFLWLARWPVDAVSGAADASELLDVDVDELAGVAALVALGRLGRIDPAELAQTDARQHR